MMDEYLSEEEQWFMVKKWLRENAVWLLVGVLIAVAGIYGWRWYQARVETQLLAAGKLYDQLTVAYDKRDQGEVTKLAAQLQSEHGGTGYAEHALLASARLYLENKQHTLAIETLQKLLGATKDAELALAVRLRIARIQIDQGKSDDALATLKGAASTGAYAPRYAEVRGDALFAKGVRDEALKAYQEALAANSPALDSELLKLKIAELSRS
jgi:predicted negative regulator of RcsB-dependent stress response